jgi:hypothetical protein
MNLVSSSPAAPSGKNTRNATAVVIRVPHSTAPARYAEIAVRSSESFAISAPRA